MCGLVAIIGPRLAPDAHDRLGARLTRALDHRGPDHRAHLSLGDVTLGHTRLRVVDPGPVADQPFSFRETHLVFSGALINYRPLRDELTREHGIAFRTRGDTEVLLHALRTWGEGALPRLEGMFAFVFYDQRRQYVLAARDRMGIKPLVWTQRSDGTILLASEAMALVQHGEIRRSIDRLTLEQLLRFNHPLGDRTFFEGVHGVDPGCALAIDVAAMQLRSRRWWTMRLAPRSASLDDAASDLDHHFRSAMKRATDVDVPLGCYLSGGVDSSGIAAELAPEQRTNLYSLVLPGTRYSEESHIDRATTFLATPTRKVRIDTLTLDDLIGYATRAEMPQWWTSDLALGALAREARRDGTAVILSGEGPDELFAGYDVYRIAHFRAALAHAGALLGAHPAATPLVRRLVPWLDVDLSVAQAWLSSHAPSRARQTLDHFGFHPEQLALWEVLTAREPLLAPDTRYREHERDYFRNVLGPRLGDLSNLEKNLAFEIGERLPRWILHMGDRMSSTHGVELRFPYLDDTFVEAALRLPLETRSTMLEDKRVLRRMHRRRLPRAIAHRRKQPLYTPTRAWLPSVLSDPRLARYWSRPAFERVGILRFETCDEARRRLEANARPDALTAMVDEWLFTFALTTSILAVDVCGA